MSEEKQVEGTEEFLTAMSGDGKFATLDLSNPEENNPQEKTPEVPAKEQLTPDQRIEVLQEISVLTGVLNSVRHLPKFDQGNKGKQEPKITGSTPLNFFTPQQNSEIAQRIIQLINLL